MYGGDQTSASQLAPGSKHALEKGAENRGQAGAMVCFRRIHLLRL
mgnify:CR=1 FL=1